ncbi:MAG: hypothetical protein V3R60_04810 [Acidobacteriota bacterium]
MFRFSVNGRTRKTTCAICGGKIPEPLFEIKLCFTHFIIYIEVKLLEFERVSRARTITEAERQDVIQFVEDNTSLLIKACVFVSALNFREQKKFSSLLLRLVAFRDVMGKDTIQMKVVGSPRQKREPGILSLRTN